MFMCIAHLTLLPDTPPLSLSLSGRSLTSFYPKPLSLVPCKPIYVHQILKNNLLHKHEGMNEQIDT